MRIEEAKEYLQTLEQYKRYFGLSDYAVRLVPQYKRDDQHLAEIEADYYEKELTVQLFNGFKKLDVAGKKKVLIHELIHARIAVFNEKSEKLCLELEEELANDLTSGVIIAEENAPPRSEHKNL